MLINDTDSAKLCKFHWLSSASLAPLPFPFGWLVTGEKLKLTGDTVPKPMSILQSSLDGEGEEWAVAELRRTKDRRDEWVGGDDTANGIRVRENVAINNYHRELNFSKHFPWPGCQIKKPREILGKYFNYSFIINSLPIMTKNGKKW